MDFAFKSVKGKREKNEDSYGSSNEKLFIVADGLGGRVAGEVASETAVDAAISSYESGKDIEEIYNDANMAIIKKIEKTPEYKGMGTTMVSCLFKNKKALIANVGDSRGYLFRKGKLELVSKDDRGLGGRLTKALGVGKKIKVHKNEIEIKKGDAILLCSDGLTDFVTDSEIKEVLEEEKNLEEKVEELVAVAMDNASTDNVTVGLINAQPH